ncbi:amidohydrolase [Rhodococcus sp. X156]|uniref:amidohydrolase n=1 Tax=Rhodococcus sp. X156 TaxID=2499145 RepID=UPI000FD7F645|nr:amidohydrolase [Rhodococcus sp. X156]
MTTDRIYRNATVHTMALQPSATPATALACRDGRFLAVGTEEEVRAAASADAEVVDLGGATVVPGFIETHLHPLMWGMLLADVDATSEACPSIEAVVEAIRVRAASTPAGEAINAWGFDDSLVAEDRALTAADLDRATTAHPVRVRHLSVHAEYVNTLVLQQCGVTAETPEPAGGHIVRDASGQPTGELQEPGAMALVADHSQAMAPDAARAGLLRAQQRMAEVGVTSFHDLYVTADMLQAYRAVHAAGELRLRGRLYVGHHLLDDAELDGAGADGAGALEAADDDQLRVGGVKLISDGSIQLHTAALSEPYHDLGGCSCGSMVIPAAPLAALVERVHAGSRQVAVHTNGDLAIDHALDAIEQAQAGRPDEQLHHRLEHVQTLREDQVQRMARLGVSASIFVNHVYYWGDRHRDRFLGPDRGARISPVASVARAGIRYALHCDCPVTPVNPLFTMATAVTRRTRQGAVLGPEQAVTPRQALAGYTSSAAALAGEDAVKGTIEVGKLADFVVLGADPLATDPAALADVPVLATVVGGRQVHPA